VIRDILRRKALWAAALLVCAAALAFWLRPGTGTSDAPAANGRRPDIILVTIDSLRADHLGVYGYDRPTSPNLDRLAAEAVVVRSHIVQAPYTKASMASLFTGLYPTSHKAFTTSRTFGEAMTGHVEGSLPVTDVLDPELWTLAGALASAGYDTVGLNTNPFLLEEFGFGNGFGDYQFLSSGENFATASEVVTAALARVERRTPGKPLFLWMHVMEPHSPYDPSADVRALFPPRQPARSVPGDTIPAWIVQDGSTDAHFYEALYDAEIREVDAALGRLFSGLRDRGLWEGTVLVVTSDHGEEFFDHGGFEHNRTLYDEMLRVPLFVRAPGLRPGMRETQTQAVDIAPTLIASAGAALPDGLAGANVWRKLRGEASGEPVAFAENVGEIYALRTPEWKFASNLQGRHELYHLTVDPAERENLAQTDPDRTGRMRDRLAALLGNAHEAGRSVREGFVPISPRVLKNLKSLGYIR
jgi:arylsulfatase A-like enzyme